MPSGVIQPRSDVKRALHAWLLHVSRTGTVDRPTLHCCGTRECARGLGLVHSIVFIAAEASDAIDSGERVPRGGAG